MEMIWAAFKIIFQNFKEAAVKNSWNISGRREYVPIIF
jgi:hypothetical protein